MFEIISIVVSALVAIASPASPNSPNFVYIAEAKTKSLASSFLMVDKVPEIPPSIIAQAEESIGEQIPAILNRIAFCESSGKHFDENGKIIKGKQNPNDIGKYQINMFYHYETAMKLGYDIFTEEGNEKYALWLYQKNGVKDWEYSKSCWDINKAL